MPRIYAVSACYRLSFKNIFCFVIISGSCQIVGRPDRSLTVGLIHLDFKKIIMNLTNTQTLKIFEVQSPNRYPKLNLKT